MNKLSERDICTKFITPALEKSGWDIKKQIREEVTFTDGRIFVRGNKTVRGKRKRADYILYLKPNIPIAVIEAKDPKNSVMSGIQQAINYAKILDVPLAYSSNGTGFYEHNRASTKKDVERNISLDEFPSPDKLWEYYKKFKKIDNLEEEKLVKQDYFFDGSSYSPRYYQQIAINRTIEAVAKNQKRILLTMATGTGKTYTAFQIIHRLWKSGNKKRILFLADRNALIDQTLRGDFRHFKDKMTVIRHKKIDKSYEIYLALYQGLTNYNDDNDAYKKFTKDFFDLVIIDECHRGSASEDSSWREILSYFNSATQIGLTATPKETKKISNIEYFGESIYTYSLRQGIDDGFLAPYKVLKIGLNTDLEGWRPEKDKKDKFGNLVEDRIYNLRDYDRNLVLEDRTKLVAQKITQFLKKNDRFDKTIVFCVDIEHAERMRSAIAKENSDLVSKNHKYVMQITGDNEEGKMELDNFTNPEEKYPVVAVTSKLMTTGIDAQTCKCIVLESNIGSMTEFKQIIGRGTRVNELYNKSFFTILDFRNVTNLFSDPDFDGDPVKIKDMNFTDDFESPEEEGSNDKKIFDEDGQEILFNDNAKEQIKINNIDVDENRRKIYVNNVDVSILNERYQYLDNNGKIITDNLKDYTRSKVLEKYKSLNNFLNKWNNSIKKKVIIDELIEEGVIINDFVNLIGKEMDLFDMICYAAFDQPPLSRKERVKNVLNKRDVFSKYSEKAKKILKSILDKYADEGVETIEDLNVLKLKPINEFGTPKEIIDLFGNKENYFQAINQLEKAIYSTV